MAIRIYAGVSIGTIGADNETIAAGPSSDFFYYALAGNDTITGSTGGVTLLGSGNDHFTATYTQGNYSFVSVNGGPGDDTLTGGISVDILYGGSGNDSLVGGAGDDWLFGDCFDQFLSFSGWFFPQHGAGGVDTILGGAGNDLIVGGKAADSLDGGTGVDVFAWEDVDEFGDTISGFATGASGDKLFFNNLLQVVAGTVASDYVRFEQSGANTLVRIDRDGPGALGFETVATLLGVQATQIVASQVIGLSPGLSQLPVFMTVLGSEWADTVDRRFSSAGPLDYSPLYTLAGNDVVTSDLGGTYSLGDGNDTFTAIAVSPPGAPPGTEFGAPNYVYGGRGSDTLNGGLDNDVLVGGSGADSLVGGNGADQLFGDCDDGWLVLCRLPGIGFVEVPGNDTLRGGAGRDLLLGGDGADHLYGGTESDLFTWEAVSEFGDLIYDFEFGENGDRLFFANLIQPQSGQGSANYVSLEQSGTDVLLYLDRDGTGPLARELVATLVGTTLAALHPNQLPGMVAGPASLTVAATVSPVTIDPFDAWIGTYWADDVEIGPSPGPNSYYFLDGDDRVVTFVEGDFSLGPGNDRFEVSEFAPNLDSLSVNGGPGSDTITGGGDDDFLIGGSGADSLIGGAGNDTIYGDGFDDLLSICAGGNFSLFGPMNFGIPESTGGGADTIRGGEGDDVIVGGAGADDVDGGPGADLFVFEFESDFGDLIRNFETGATGDRILLNGLVRLVPGATVATSYVSKVQNGANTELWVDLDATEGAFQPQLFATLVGMNAAQFDIATHVLLGEEFRTNVVPNNPPVSSNGAIDATEDLSFNGTLPAATDANGDPITYALFQPAAYGSVDVAANGSFSYVPALDFYGADSFRFSVSDGKGGSNDYLVTINVASVIDTITGTAGNDNLVDPTGGPSLLLGLAGRDMLTGGSHDDTLDGGAGIDSAIFAGVRANYAVSLGATKTVTAQTGNEGTDTLVAMERLIFSDAKLAIDFDSGNGNAAITAKIIGAVFGAPEVSNQIYTGIGLFFLDSGWSYEDLMLLALNARLGAGFTNAAEITLLYQNLVNITLAPGAPEIAQWEATMASAPFTQASLAVFAANTDFNTGNIGLAGLQNAGLPYIEYQP